MGVKILQIIASIFFIFIISHLFLFQIHTLVNANSILMNMKQQDIFQELALIQ